MAQAASTKQALTKSLMVISDSQVPNGFPPSTSSISVSETHAIVIHLPLEQRLAQLNLDSEPMDVDAESLNGPGHFHPLGIEQSDGRSWRMAEDTDTDAQDLPFVTRGVSELTLNPSAEDQAVWQRTATQPAADLAAPVSIAPYQTATISDNPGFVSTPEMSQDHIGTFPGGWPGSSGVGDTSAFFASSSTAVEQNGATPQVNANEWMALSSQTGSSAFPGTETSQHASESGPVSWQGVALAQPGFEVHNDTLHSGAIDQPFIQARFDPVPANLSSQPAALDSGPVHQEFDATLAQCDVDMSDPAPDGMADPVTSVEWGPFAWTKSVLGQASRLMAFTEQQVRQTAMQVARATGYREGYSARASVALEEIRAAKEDITPEVYSEGWTKGQSDAKEGEESAITEAFEEGKKAGRAELRRMMARADARAHNQSADFQTTVRAAQAEINAQQRRIGDLEARLSSTAQSFGVSLGQAETGLEGQRETIQQLRDEVAGANAQADELRLQGLQQTVATEQLQAQLNVALEESSHLGEIITRLRTQLDSVGRANMQGQAAFTALGHERDAIAQRRDQALEQVDALKQERDELAEALANERARITAAPQAPSVDPTPTTVASAPTDGYNQDTGMEHSDIQGISFQSDGSLDPVELEGLLAYHPRAFQTHRAVFIRMLEISVSDVLAEGSRMLEDRDITAFGRRQEFRDPSLGFDRICKLVRTIGVPAVENAVQSAELQIDSLANALGNSQIESRQRPQPSITQEEYEDAMEPRDQGTDSTPLDVSPYEELETESMPTERQVDGSTGLIETEQVPSADVHEAMPPPAATSTIAFDAEDFERLMRAAGGITVPEPARRQPRTRHALPAVNRSEQDISSLITSFGSSVTLGGQAAGPAAPLQDITRQDTANVNHAGPSRAHQENKTKRKGAQAPYKSGR